MAGLERIYALWNSFRIAAVNLSLGRLGSMTNCDGDPTKAAIDNLRSVGIATVVASGNESSTKMVSIPSCVASVITVGATAAFSRNTTESEYVAEISNSSPLVELFAPGVQIVSSLPGAVLAPCMA